MIISRLTSADLFDEVKVGKNKLSMSTLEMSQVNSANFSRISSLFTIYDMKPEGFAVGSVKIKKTGKIDFKYHISAEIVGALSPLCSALDLEVWNERTTVYTGKLTDVSLDKTFNEGKKDDWIFFIALNREDTALKNQECTFVFTFKTFRTNPSDQKGFWDQEKLTNSVTTGSWSN